MSLSMVGVKANTETRFYPGSGLEAVRPADRAYALYYFTPRVLVEGGYKRVGRGGEFLQVPVVRGVVVYLAENANEKCCLFSSIRPPPPLLQEVHPLLL